MSRLQSFVQWAASRFKHDADYRIASAYSDRQLVAILWYRGLQLIRGLPLRALLRGVRGAVFRGRRVVIEHGYQLRAGPGLILEDDVFISALSANGMVLGRNVTIARGASLVCTGVVARMGIGIRIGDRSAIGAGSFLGGQGGIVIGADVIMGPGVRIFSENHVASETDRPIRAQSETRRGVEIGDDCWIGAGATIVDGVIIGTGCVVAAGAVVTRSVASYAVVAGVPAKVIRTRSPQEPDGRTLREVP